MLKGTGSGAPTKDDVKSLASAETARLRLRRAALCGASMASELLVAKHTKETAHSSRTKEFFQLEAKQSATRFALQGLFWQLPRD